MAQEEKQHLDTSDTKYFVSESNQKNVVKNGPETKKSTYVLAIILAIIPYTGIIGIHDFVAKRNKKGIVHIAITVIAVMIFFITKFVGTTSSLSSSLIIELSMVIFIGLYIWALIEIIEIKESKRTQLITKNNPDTKLEETIKNKKYSIISLIATIIPIGLLLFCLIYSGGSFEENGRGVIWFYLIMYYGSIGIPLTVVALVNGERGLKTKYRKTAIASIAIKIIHITVIISFLLFKTVF